MDIYPLLDKVEATLAKSEVNDTTVRPKIFLTEYVARGSTVDYATGVRMWKTSPNNDTGYQYFKYYMLVKYLFDTEKLTVGEVFNRDFDRAALEVKVLGSL